MIKFLFLCIYFTIIFHLHQYKNLMVKLLYNSIRRDLASAIATYIDFNANSSVVSPHNTESPKYDVQNVIYSPLWDVKVKIALRPNLKTKCMLS